MKYALVLTLAVAAVAPAVAAPAALPIYPGATKVPRQMSVPIQFCGSKMTMEGYDVKDATAQTVGAWYASHTSGGITVKISKPNQTAIEVFQPDGRAGAVITQMHYDPALAAAAKSIRADRTGLGIMTFDPPLSSDVIAMVSAAGKGDASATARMKAQCAQSKH